MRALHADATSRFLQCPGAACLTCRQKSRKCDRARPMCRRCISKGLQCGGYPDKFRFCGIASRGKWKNQDAPVSESVASKSENPPVGKGDVSSEPNTPDTAVPSQSLTPVYQTEIENILKSAEAEKFLTHCTHMDSSLNDILLI